MGWAKDMLLLQMCAHALGPAAFLARVLQRGGLGGHRPSVPAAASTEPAQQQVPQQGARAACEVPEEAVPADEATAAADAALAAADVPEPAVLEELLQLLLLLLKGWGCTEAAALRSALVS